MPISPEEKKKSQEFINALNSLLEMVDDISQYIPEGKYLEMMNQLKLVNDTAENPIVNIVEVLNKYGFATIAAIGLGWFIYFIYIYITTQIKVKLGEMSCRLDPAIASGG